MTPPMTPHESDPTAVFRGCLPALMTPCGADGSPELATLVATARSLVAAGMRGVVYCGSMGDWPLLTDAQRQAGVAALVDAGIAVVVGTGAQSTRLAATHAAHAAAVGAAGLMVIPRVLSRGSSPAAQRDHFDAVLAAGEGLPAVIYNSPHYGFQTEADLFFALRRRHPHLVGFKEFGGADALSQAAETITSGDDALCLLVGVDTQVMHGFVRCGAVGAITGVGNAMPAAVLRLCELSRRAAHGNASARRLAAELSDAMATLAAYDEGPDLVLYYKRLMTLAGHDGYEHSVQPSDSLSPTQRAWVDAQWHQFQAWWNGWPGRDESTVGGASS